MRQVLMTTHGKRKVLRHNPSPLLTHPRARILIEGAIHFDEIENFRIGLQRRLAGNLEIRPAARSDEIINQVSTLEF
jgi:hypothetical protein